MASSGARRKEPPKHRRSGDGVDAGPRLPPSSIEAEQAVLGGLMLSPDLAWEKVADILTDCDFYRADHALIFRAIGELSNKGVPADAVTLGEWFEAQGVADRVGGAQYILALANGTPSAANIAAYAEIVRDKALLRRVIDEGTEITSAGFNPEGRTALAVVEEAEQRVFSLSEAGGRSRKGVVQMRDAVKAAYGILRDRYENGGGVTGLSTGLIDLDALTTGLQPTDLIIIAARPSMGKTALACGIGEHVAVRTKKAVAIFSMEMSSPQIAMRFIASLGRIDQQRLRTGDLDDTDWPRVTTAMMQLRDAKIFVDDTPALSPGELRSRARRLKREHDIALVVVDYLQLMTVPNTRENRATEISEVSRALKALAKELNVPVIALSQLNRSVEQRGEKRPMMSDLRESGAIEQDADVIAFIYRDEYYNKDSPDKGLAEIIIAKQRNGPTGTVKVAFIGAHTRFANAGRESDAFGSDGA